MSSKHVSDLQKFGQVFRGENHGWDITILDMLLLSKTFFNYIFGYI